MEATKTMSTTQSPHNERKFRSPNRILARSFRLARDKWKQKHHELQLKFIRAKKLADERDRSRSEWRERCEQATARANAAEAQQQLQMAELEAARIRIRELEADSKKKK